ncbi:type IV toxin-antitoxin system AbiEi family antitoxin domain-containing protein [Kribbella sp. NPDC026596]|uniref:type IV toxin-antitoxin system AbiEi family antitoxin domain-containing protein n=1 Tax=Kribbella sp. NPDC026596 TaxID=3155122 RepID=UPI003401697F
MNPKLSVFTAARRGWFTRADAVESGYSDSELRRRLRAGQWSRLSRDVYVEPATWPADEPSWDRARRLHLLRTRAVVDRMGAGVVVSHQSAVLLHGLPTWGLDLTKVHLTKPLGRTRSDAVAEVHRSRFDPGEITVVDGLRVVTPARAITETACASSYEVGVVLGDAALHQRLVSVEALAAMADRHAYWSGSPAARAAARFADGLSESVGESRLRVLMANHGLPAPILQAEIRDEGGRLIGRVDFLLCGRLIVEFDGAVKYGEDAGGAVLAEKWREDRLRACGYRVIRISWADLDQPQVTADRIRRAAGTPA